MNDLISQIKNHFQIQAIVAPYTGGLVKPNQTTYGNYYNGWCPWCQNGVAQRGKNRRFWVNIQTQFCGCLHPDCCVHPMDVINFYGRIWSISNAEAIEDLRLKMLGIKVIRNAA